MPSGIEDESICHDPIALHNLVAKDNCPNFMGAKIGVNFDFNCDLFEHLLEGYWDWQISQFMRYGLPIDFCGDINNLQTDRWAHPFALEFEEHVTVYVNEECKHKALYGPFKCPPFGQKTHTSPVITRPKSGSEKRRVIIDLSWPPLHSVNAFTPSTSYLGTMYKLQLPTVKD